MNQTKRDSCGGKKDTWHHFERHISQAKPVITRGHGVVRDFAALWYYTLRCGIAARERAAQAFSSPGCSCPWTASKGMHFTSLVRTQFICVPSSYTSKRRSTCLAYTEMKCGWRWGWRGYWISKPLYLECVCAELALKPNAQDMKRDTY